MCELMKVTKNKRRRYIPDKYFDDEICFFKFCIFIKKIEYCKLQLLSVEAEIPNNVRPNDQVSM